ncbi:MAG: hypothetical protein KF901_13020 [Myxococcales bacterium]|nr:hypothetical protein [Myxococcales bacterium]
MQLPLAERAPPRVARAPLERCGADEPLHDYILERYAPPAPPEGKLRALNLFVESLADAGVEREGLRVIDTIREGLGPHRTVFGVKSHTQKGAEPGWELYFYDFERVHADLQIGRVVELLGGLLDVDAVEPWPLPWHMFSVELSPEHLRRERPASVDVYLDMRSYKVRGTSWELENVYTFHDPRQEIDELLHRARSLVHFDHLRWNLAHVLPPDFLAAHRVCVANKRRADAVYASRVPTPALTRFLERHSFPSALSVFARRHAAELDHLLWDVGVDFQGTDGELRFVKAGVYGSF